jgi:hypothetical protein
MTQVLFGIAIVAALLGLAVYYGVRQFQVLRALRHGPELDPDEHAFVRNQAYRRLVLSLMLLALAVLFVGMFFLEGPAADLVRVGEQARAQNVTPELDPAQKAFVNVYAWYWVAVLLLLMAVLGLAAYELFAIRRFSVRRLRQIQADRRDMIAEEAEKLRARRRPIE